MNFFKDGIIVIEDFYKDPDSVRKFALKQEYGIDYKQNFPGKQSYNLHLANLKQGFAKIVGAKRIVIKNTWAFGSFRLSNQFDKGRSHVHFDEPDWSVVVYLTPILEQEIIGTSFFKHKESGLIGPCHNIKRIVSWDEIRQYGEKIIAGKTHDLEYWEKLKSINYRYNRMVCFRGRNIFHSPGPGFGDSKDSSRLTQHFFFDVE